MRFGVPCRRAIAWLVSKIDYTFPCLKFSHDQFEHRGCSLVREPCAAYDALCGEMLVGAGTQSHVRDRIDELVRGLHRVSKALGALLHNYGSPFNQGLGT